MSVLTPSRETELDAFDLDLRVTVADINHEASLDRPATEGADGCPNPLPPFAE